MTVQRDPEAFADQWAARVLRPGPLTPADRTAIAAALRRCYFAARLRPPSLVLWFPQPDAAAAVASREALVQALLAARPWLRGRERVRRVLLPGWRAGWSALTGAGAGLLLVFALLMAQAMAGWFGLIGGLLGTYWVVVTRLRVRDRGPRAGRWAGYALVALMLLAVLALVARPGSLVTDVSGARWPDLAALVLVPAGALLGAAAGWRSGRRAYPAALERLVADVGGRIAGDVTARSRRAETVGRAGPPPSWATWTRVSSSTLPGRLSHVVAPSHLLGWAWWASAASAAGGGPRTPWAAVDRRALAAHETVARAGWTASRRVAVLVEPPVAVHSGPDGIGRWDGPAVEWADGSVWYALRGVRLPRCPADGGWTLAEIHAVRNTEVRRIMIESIGWEEYLRRAEAGLVASVPDPGNAPHELTLYEAPPDFGDRVRMLVMTNASPDRSGALRRYVELVPDRFDDPIEAVAWQYGVSPEVYRELVRRT